MFDFLIFLKLGIPNALGSSLSGLRGHPRFHRMSIAVLSPSSGHHPLSGQPYGALGKSCQAWRFPASAQQPSPLGSLSKAAPDVSGCRLWKYFKEGRPAVPAVLFTVFPRKTALAYLYNPDLASAFSQRGHAQLTTGLSVAPNDVQAEFTDTQRRLLVELDPRRWCMPAETICVSTGLEKKPTRVN